MKSTVRATWATPGLTSANVSVARAAALAMMTAITTNSNGLP
jgi:hypothetical protein